MVVGSIAYNEWLDESPAADHDKNTWNEAIEAAAQALKLKYTDSYHEQDTILDFYQIGVNTIIPDKDSILKLKKP